MSAPRAAAGDRPADPYKQANADDPDLDNKVDDLVRFMQSCKFGMMTTHEATTSNLVSRCMALAATETGGIDLLFHTNTESGKTHDVSSDPHVNVSFLNASGEWASVAGQASVATNRDLVRKHYSPALRAWLGDLGDGTHDGSENDPRIGIIRVKMQSATYALVSKGLLGRAAEVVEGAVTGKPAQVNSLREISHDEVKQWRAGH